MVWLTARRKFSRRSRRCRRQRWVRLPRVRELQSRGLNRNALRPTWRPRLRGCTLGMRRLRRGSGRLRGKCGRLLPGWSPGEKLFALVLTQAPEEELLELRQRAAAEIAPYRSRMPAMQIRQVEQQFLHKRLFEKRDLPRLSLFYMSQE